MKMTHPSEETLNDYVERDLTPAEHVRVATHLETCADCALFVTDVQQIARDASALGPMEPPPQVWNRIQSSIVHRPASFVERPASFVGRSTMDDRRSTLPRFSWALATAALVVLAFLTGRLVNQREQQSTSQHVAGVSRVGADQAVVRERVLLIAVGDHLERSQMVLVELAHAESNGPLDISAERQLADDLVASNRLYRQTAQQMGQDNVAGVLDELERVLVEVARGPSTVSMQQLADIQQRIESQGILFKVKVIGSEIRQQPVS
jgi:hypothetical protein